jgi:sulfate adenylyltransferase subunit 2
LTSEPLGVWEYILSENIQVVPLYFAAERPVVRSTPDQRLKPRPSEKVEIRKVRFRTLGCYPPTGAIESNATTVAEILQNARAIFE